LVVGAVVFSLIGVGSALTSEGRWYLIVGTITFFGAVVAFASNAVRTARSLGDSHTTE
jgi:hypothetical protein